MPLFLKNGDYFLKSSWFWGAEIQDYIFYDE